MNQIQLSDNVSLILTHPPEPTITTHHPSKDPSYFFDLKEHLNNNSEYIKARITWRKLHPEILDMFTVKERFFEYYKENDLPTFHRDIETFLRNHHELTAEDGAKMFCGKFKGYEMTYGVEFVKRAILKTKGLENV